MTNSKIDNQEKIYEIGGKKFHVPEPAYGQVLKVSKFLHNEGTTLNGIGEKTEEEYVAVLYETEVAINIATVALVEINKPWTSSFGLNKDLIYNYFVDSNGDNHRLVELVEIVPDFLVKSAVMFRTQQDVVAPTAGDKEPTTDPKNSTS